MKLIGSIIPILAHTQDSYAHAIKSHLGKGYDHAALLYAEYIRTGKMTAAHPAFGNAQALLQDIFAITDVSLPSISTRLQDGQTEKFLLRLADGLEVESVVIPMKFGRSLCVSSQVGCRMGCTFCQTGRMGLIRNLKAEEIIAQLYTAQNVLGYEVRNVVFMGMGEPLDNFDEVMQAVTVMVDPAGFGLGRRHVTLSTSGRIDGIQRLMNKKYPAVNLAISVNASNEAVRKKIMPITRKYSMPALKQALLDYCAVLKRPILAEYVLLQGHNDSTADANELADYLQGLDVKVNLIPYNPQKPDAFQPPDKATVDAFAEVLRHRGYQTLIRNTKGCQIMAACGQLGKERIK